MRHPALSRSAAAATLRALILPLTVAAALACGGGPAEQPLVPALADGIFLPDGWLDLPASARWRQESGRRLVAAPALTLRDGWSAPEPWGVWSVGRGATLDLRSASGGARDLVLDVLTPERLPARQRVEVELNGTALGTFETGDGSARVRLAVDDGILRPGRNRLTLHHAHHVEPADGRRPLALGLERLALVTPGSEPAGAGGPPPVLADPGRDTFFLLRPGTWVVPMTVPAAQARAVFSLRAGAGARLGVRAIDLTGEERTLLAPEDGEGEGERELVLDGYAGRRIFLAFDAAVPTGTRIELRAPRMYVHHGRGGTPDPQRPGDGGAAVANVDPSELPDILMIVLDAARADRFGVYGYRRDTTPNLDALARDALVFRDVVAECPYTLCSSPSFMAGLSYPQHRVVKKGQRLPAEATTLAEALDHLGYRTVAYTANPNNSAATGAEQGFDEFYEVWQYVSGRQRTHPGPLARAIAERIAQGFEGEPVFLFAHFVPPHEPYDPDPEHDLFGDPTYDGPIDGSIQQTRDIFARKMALDEADRQRLEALYDGNLRQADAWLQEIFDAQRETGRFEDTLLIVTSDHGEAFGEHGRYGHNTQVYREMMQVPLIVRLPGGRRPEGVDTERLASLSSVVPTVLGALGQPPPPAVVAPDLLLPPRGPEPVIFQRDSDGSAFAVTTPRFKAVIRDGSSAELYDRRADPEERDDLAAERPELLAGLLALLEQALAAPPSFGAPEDGEGALSPEDEEMLRSLGYA